MSTTYTIYCGRYRSPHPVTTAYGVLHRLNLARDGRLHATAADSWPPHITVEEFFDLTSRGCPTLAVIIARATEELRTGFAPPA